MPKFDVVVGNPPYQGKTYIDFLNLSFKIGKEHIIMIHPALVYLHNRPVKRTKNHIFFRDNIYPYIYEIYLLNATKYFPEIIIATPLAISYINKLNKTSEVLIHNDVTKKTYNTNINKIHHLYENTEIFEKLKNKILSYANSIDNLLNHKETNGNFYVNIPLIRGSISNDPSKFYEDNYFTFFKKDLTVSTTKQQVYFGFKTEIEAENFLNYLKTKFARFALTLYKITVHQDGSELLAIPWLDFSKKWTDQKLYDFFKLSDEEINIIENNPYIFNYYK